MINAYRLKTEYLTDAVGIDILTPRVFWELHSRLPFSCESL